MSNNLATAALQIKCSGGSQLTDFACNFGERRLPFGRRQNAMDWWIWIVLGLVLLLGEMITPGGFYILFFGVGAIIVGILAGFNIAGPVWLQIIVFTGLSLLTFWLFRQRLVQSTHLDSPAEVDTLIGETAVVTEDIPSSGIGKAEMRGTSWSAHNVSKQSLARGQRCRVERVEGLTIYVRAEEN